VYKRHSIDSKQSKRDFVSSSSSLIGHVHYGFYWTINSRRYENVDESVAFISFLSFYFQQQKRSCVYYIIIQHIMQEYKTYATVNELPLEESKNKLVKLIPDQNITIIPEYTLESGVTLTNIPIAWKTWGKLNDKADNCMVICHALTGSADVEDW